MNLTHRMLELFVSYRSRGPIEEFYLSAPSRTELEECLCEMGLGDVTPRVAVAGAVVDSRRRWVPNARQNHQSASLHCHVARGPEGLDLRVAHEGPYREPRKGAAYAVRLGIREVLRLLRESAPEPVHSEARNVMQEQCCAG